MTNIPVLDGHNDTLLKLRFPERGEERNFFERSDVGHIDLPRAREGGFGGGFFACYVRNPENDGWTEESALTLTKTGYEVADAPPLDPVYARSKADELVGVLFDLEAESEDELEVVRTAREIESCLSEGVLAAILHFEGAENLGPDPGALEDLYEVGLRSRRPLPVPVSFRHGPGADRCGEGACPRVQPAWRLARPLAPERVRLLGCSTYNGDTSRRDPLERSRPVSDLAQPHRQTAGRDTRL
jgi:hypothetical protein